MLNRRTIQYLLFIIVLIVVGVWFLQSAYYSVINDKLMLRKKLKENIEIEIQNIELRKKYGSKNMDLYDQQTKSIKKFMQVSKTFSDKQPNFDKTLKSKSFVPKAVYTVKSEKDKTKIIKEVDSGFVKEKGVAEKKTFNSVSETEKSVRKSTEVVTVIPTFNLHSASEAEDLYFSTITKDTFHCDHSKRYGRSDDGGWDVCLMGKLKLTTGNCFVYSFGVNYIWEFDDELSTTFKCTVRTFDPSMTNEPETVQRQSKVWFYKWGLGKENTVWNNGWKIMTLSSLMNKFDERNKVIDILKIDIEFSEWDSFEAILKDGIFANVKQLLFETHTEEVQGRPTTMQNYVRFLKIWTELQQLGFRQWKHHWNHFGNFQSQRGQQRTCCYEHYLVNTHFL